MLNPEGLNAESGEAEGTEEVTEKKKAI